MSGIIRTYKLTLAANTAITIEEPGVVNQAFDIAIRPAGENPASGVKIGDVEKQELTIGGGINIGDLSRTTGDESWALEDIYIKASGAGDVEILLTKIK